MSRNQDSLGVPSGGSEPRLGDGLDVLAAAVRGDDGDLVAKLRTGEGEGVDVEVGGLGPARELAKLVSKL